jgi:hypothetical protein
MENRSEVERICSLALFTHNEIVNMRANIENLRRLTELQEGRLRLFERYREQYAREIRQLGYHDIGHARTVLAREPVDHVEGLQVPAVPGDKGSI